MTSLKAAGAVFQPIFCAKIHLLLLLLELSTSRFISVDLVKKNIQRKYTIYYRYAWLL